MEFAFDQRPVIVAIAGPNGAGKSTFFDTYIAPSKLFFINADIIARESETSAYDAAEAAGQMRDDFIARRESFVFETVLSDPVGDKIAFLERATAEGYTVVFFFIGVRSAALSHNRVRMRVSQGGHGVPQGKLDARYPRTMANLSRAIKKLPSVLVFDNSDLRQPYRLFAEYQSGQLVKSDDLWPEWFRDVIERDAIG